MTHTKWGMIDRKTRKLIRDAKDRPLIFNSRKEARSLAWGGPIAVKLNVVVKNDYSVSY